MSLEDKIKERRRAELILNDEITEQAQEDISQFEGLQDSIIDAMIAFKNRSDKIARKKKLKWKTFYQMCQK